jgi:hypothetical protein
LARGRRLLLASVAALGAIPKQPLAWSSAVTIATAARGRRAAASGAFVRRTADGAVRTAAAPAVRSATHRSIITALRRRDRSRPSQLAGEARRGGRKSTRAYGTVHQFGERSWAEALVRATDGLDLRLL